MGLEGLYIPLIIAGTAVSAYSAYESGQQAKRDAKAQQELAERNALLKERQAKAELERGQEESRRIREFGEEVAGTQQVAFAKGGVLTTTGTPAIVKERTEADILADAEQVLQDALLAESFRLSEAENLRFGGRIAKARGAAAARGAKFAAAGSILSGIGTAAYLGSTLKSPGTKDLFAGSTPQAKATYLRY